MNTKIILISFMVLMASIKVFAIEVANFAKPINHLNKSFSHKSINPILNYDNNTGNVSAEFKVSLPKGTLPIRNEVQFRYLSQLQANIGYGVGVDINLPRIIRVNGNPRVKYLYDSGSEVVELKEKDKDLIPVSFKVFRTYNKVDGDKYLVTLGDGKKEYFDKNGNLIKEVFPGVGNEINYSWETNLLSSIELSNNENVVFNYSKCNSDLNLKNKDYAFFYKGNLRDQTICLRNISLGAKVVDFHYNNYRNLTQVNYKNGLFHLFKAQYSELKEGADRIIEVEKSADDKIVGDTVGDKTIEISENNKVVRVYKEQDFYDTQLMKKSRVLKFFDLGTFAEILTTDFNRDGITDYLVYKVAVKPGKLEVENLLDLDPVLGFTDVSVDKKPSWGPIQMEIRYGVLKDNNSKVSFETKGPQLSSVFNHTKIENNFKEVEDHFGDYGADEMQYGLSFNSVPLMGDFDGNGLNDILLCGERNKIAYNLKNKFDEQDLNINCPKESTAYDLNGDGLTDIITKEKVYISQGHAFVEKNYSNSEIKAIQTALSSDDGIKYGIFDKDYDGAPDIFKESDIMAAADFDNDLEMDIIKKGDNSKYYSMKIYPALPLLKTIENIEGGKSTFKYEIQAGVPVVTEIEKNNLNVQNVLERNYFGVFGDPLASKFLGFSITQSVEKPTQWTSGKKVISQYFKDNDDADLLKRAAFHGVIDSQYTCEIDNCNKLVSQLLNGETPSVQWLSLVRNEYRLVDPLVKGSYYLRRYSRTKQSYKKENNVFMGLEAMNTSSEILDENEFSKFGPLVTMYTKCDECLLTDTGADEIAQSLVQKIKKYKIYNNRYLLSEEKSFKRLKGRKTLVSHESNIFNGKIEDGDYSVTSISNVNEGVKETVLTYYNSSNQRSKIIDKYGSSSTFSYEKDRIIKVDPFWSKLTLFVDNFGNTLKEELVNGDYYKSINQEYSTDNYLIGLETESISYNVEYKNISNGLKKTIYAKGDNEELSQVNIYDGFGQKLHSYLVQDGKYQLKESQLIDSMGRTLSINSTSFANELNYNEIFSFDYRHINKQTTKKNHIDNLVEQKVYYGLSEMNYLNGEFQSEISKSFLNPITYFRSNTKEMAIEAYDDDKVSVLDNYKFFRDLKGNIDKVYTKNNKLVFSQMLSPEKKIINDMYIINNDKKGKVESVENFFDGDVQTYTYDSIGRLLKVDYIQLNHSEEVVYNQDNTIAKNIIQIDDNSYTLKSEYNVLKKAKAQTLEKNGKELYSFDYNYHAGKLTRVSNDIPHIIYNKYGGVAKINYKNASLEIITNATGKIQQLSLGDTTLNYKYDSNAQISEIALNSSQEKKSYKYTYNKDLQVNELPSNKIAKSRDDYKNLVNDDLVYLDPSLGLLESLEGKKVRYKNIDSIFSVGEEKYISNSLHNIRGVDVKYVRLGQKIIGAYICKSSCEFYPILTDHLNSVIAIFNEHGNRIVSRSYSTWGELETTHTSLNGKEINDLIRYDFAGLIRPLDSKYLISSSRIYIPTIGEWHKIDNLVLTKPEMFISGSYLETDGLSYVGKNPVNKVDPSGHIGIPGFAVGGAVGAISAGLAAMANPNASAMDVVYSSAIGFVAGGLAGAVGAMHMAGSAGAVAVTKAMAGGIFAFTGNLMTQAVTGGSKSQISMTQAFVAMGLGASGTFISSGLSSMGGYAAASSSDLGTSFAIGLSLAPVDMGLSAMMNEKDEMEFKSSSKAPYDPERYSMGVNTDFGSELEGFNEVRDYGGYERDFDNGGSGENEGSGNEVDRSPSIER